MVGGEGSLLGVSAAGAGGHATRFERWRPDKDPGACNLDQLERPAGPGFASMVG
jgi:hypothetical protein